MTLEYIVDRVIQTPFCEKKTPFYTNTAGNQCLLEDDVSDDLQEQVDETEIVPRGTSPVIRRRKTVGIELAEREVSELISPSGGHPPCHRTSATAGSSKWMNEKRLKTPVNTGAVFLPPTQETSCEVKSCPEQGGRAEKWHLGPPNFLANPCDEGMFVEPTSKSQFDVMNIKQMGNPDL